MANLRPVVISGPSGCGKSTLLNILFKNYKDAFGFSVSHTSRSPREGEIDGQHYNFSTREQMRKEIQEGKFIEHAEFSENLYGTSKKAVEDVLENKICILDIEEQGVRSIKASHLDALFVFVKPPSIDELRNRLVKRGTETEEAIEKRMATAKSAIEFSQTPGVYDLIVVNDNLQHAYEELETFLTEKIEPLKDMRTPLEADQAQTGQCMLL
ncbi:guanylate kinase-like [Styela clava]